MHGDLQDYEYKPVATDVEGMYIIEDSTGPAEFTAGKIMTQQQASLHAPDSMGFDFKYGDAAYEAVKSMGVIADAPSWRRRAEAAGDAPARLTTM